MADAASSGTAAAGFWDRVGWRGSRRPDARLGYVLGAAAGAFAVAATVALVVEVTSDDPTAPGVLLDLALFALAFAAGMKLPGPIRSAAVTAMVLTTPVIWFFAFASDGATQGALRGVYLLSIATYALLYAFGWTRGRAILLGLALVFASAWILFEVNGDGSATIPFQDQIESESSSSFGSSSDDPFSDDFGEDDSDTTTSVIALLLGLGQLGAAAALDRRGRLGASTPLLVVGALYAVIGAVAIGGNEDPAAAGVLLALVGVAIGGVGALGGSSRRGSIWIGVITIFSGVAIMVGDLAGSSALGVAGLAALAAIVIGAIAMATGAHEGSDEEAGSTTSS